MIPPEQATGSFDSAAVARLLDGEQGAVRARVREVLARPSFRYLPAGVSTELQREQAFRWCRELAEAGVGLLAVPPRHGGEGDFAAFMAAFETVAFHDLGMTIKFTVQFGIWLGSVLLLGNERQHEEFLRRIGTFELPGCFAMTEIGHGSNVRELETTAVYEAEREEFIVHSPTWTAGKNYIGNGACHGRLATVFAQLETRGKRHGVHAFLVPLRGEDGAVLPGVRIEDNGSKMGQNGVDNARIWFDRVRVGRGALLDRFGGVAADGSYRSEIESAGARFFATISALVGGRISIALAGLSAGKSGLAIAVKYATRRRQFRAPGATEETALLDYPTHQRRLLPLVANAYALDFALKDLVRRRVETMEGGTRKGEGGSEVGGGVWGTAEEPRTKFTKAEGREGEKEERAGNSEGREKEASRKDAKTPREEGERKSRKEVSKAEGGEREEGSRRAEEEREGEGGAGGRKIEAEKRELELLAAGIKAWGTWNTTQTLQTCRECCGGEGYLSINRLPALKADSDIFTTFEGDNTVLMLWVGRQLLADAERSGKPNVMTTGRAAAERGEMLAAKRRQGEGEEGFELWVGNFLREATERWAGESRPEVRPGSARELFTQRAEGCIEEIRGRLALLAEEGIRGHEAMSRQQNALLAAAQAHVERVLLEQFLAVVAGQKESGLGVMLERLCELFVLSRLEAHRAWYLERRLIPEGMSRALGYRVDRLCAELAPDAEALVEAFGIPAQCLGAPIAGV